MNASAFFIPNPEIHGETISLCKPISAIQLVTNETGRAKLGLLSQLGAGITVERCGEGFNERTAKVRVNGLCYFVFVQDLESQGPLRRN